MRAKNKLVYGVGLNDLREPVTSEGRSIPMYTVWQSMLQRCYSAKEHARYPTYSGCTVDPRWYRLSVFKLWFDANWRPGYHLDKDILVPENKVYGPDTCVFVPAHINNLLTDRRNARGILPLGVTRNGTGFEAACKSHGQHRLRRMFPNLPDAVAWYKATKARVIRRTATDALVRREINIRVHAALLRRARELS